jgi:hypothetical protein
MPQQTIQLLNQLQALGLTDADFYILHHGTGKWSRQTTIHEMRRYCGTVSEFKSATNTRVRLRLKLVLEAFVNGDFSRPAPTGVFRRLCEDAVRKIPKS